MPYITLFYRLILRPLRRERLRTCLTVIAIALGVAAVLAIELAGSAAAGSFRSSMETLTGSAGFEATATGGIDPKTLTSLAALPYPLKLRPRMEEYAMIVDTRRTVPLLGVDMLTESVTSDHDFSAAAAWQRDDSIWTGSGLGYKPGDRVKILVNDREAEYTVRGVLGERSGEVVVMDLATASHIFRPDGRLDRILIEVPADRSIEDWQGLLTKTAPPGVTIEPVGARTEENRRMLAAFRWNLRVLSYISLAVGAFLIYNTISVSVVRRRVEIGILRALGATRGAILIALLGEAAALGLLGGLAGIGLGRFMAQGAVKSVSATVESLYVSSRPGPISLTWETVLLALAIGVGISVLSALAPAREASRVVPVEAMGRGRREHEARVHQARSLACAAVFAAFAWIASLQQPIGGKPVFGYLAAILPDRGIGICHSGARVGRVRDKCADSAPDLRSGSSARDAQPGGIAPAYIRVDRCAVHCHRDVGRSRHHGREFPANRSGLDGGPSPSRSVLATRDSSRGRSASYSLG